MWLELAKQMLYKNCACNLCTYITSLFHVSNPFVVCTSFITASFDDCTLPYTYSSFTDMVGMYILHDCINKWLLCTMTFAYSNRHDIPHAAHSSFSPCLYILPTVLSFVSLRLHSATPCLQQTPPRMTSFVQPSYLH